MTEQPTSLRPYTHRVFVDFSGDDGSPNTPGSSAWIVVAWVLSSEQSIPANEQVVKDIKKLIGCKAGDELKYRALRRHPKKLKALQLLSRLDVNVVMLAMLKGGITDPRMRDTKTKYLVSVLHAMPMWRLRRYLGPDYCVQVVMDEVSWSGSQDAIRREFQAANKVDWSQARPDWLYFVRSGGNLMIQLADILCGMGREYVEALPAKRPPCIVCRSKGQILLRAR